MARFVPVRERFGGEHGGEKDVDPIHPMVRGSLVRFCPAANLMTERSYDRPQHEHAGHDKRERHDQGKAAGMARERARPVDEQQDGRRGVLQFLNELRPFAP